MPGRFLLLSLIACIGSIGSGCSSASRQAHDDAVEQHRQQQAAQALPAPAAATSPSPQASAAVSPGTADTAAQQPAPTRNYWTNFRGPKRDGKYDETTISTNWPANGLPVIWKEPV